MRTQLTSAFDFRVQVLECERCGAPVTGTEGIATCEYCHATLRLGSRTTAIAVSPEAMGPLRYVPNPQRDAWLRATLTPGHRSPYDVKANVPPDLAPFAESVSIDRWRKWADPALRERWRALTAQAAAGPVDEATRYRLYWVAIRLSDGLSVLAGDTTGNAAYELRLKQRAVLETALNLLPETGYVYLLQCRMVVSAALLGDVTAAKAWLSGLDPYPGSADVDCVYRLAAAAILKLEGNDRGLLELLGPLGAEIPMAGEHERLYADCYRIHAYERLGDRAAWTQALDRAKAAHGRGLLYGAFETAGIAPEANQKLVSSVKKPLVILIALAFGLPFALGLIVAAVALFMHFVLGYE